MLQETQKYEYLERMIAKRGIRKTIIARVVGISPKTLTNKVNGKAAFTWPEVQATAVQNPSHILVACKTPATTSLSRSGTPHRWIPCAAYWVLP